MAAVRLVRYPAAYTSTLWRNASRRRSVRCRTVRPAVQCMRSRIANVNVNLYSEHGVHQQLHVIWIWKSETSGSLTCVRYIDKLVWHDNEAVLPSTVAPAENGPRTQLSLCSVCVFVVNISAVFLFFLRRSKFWQTKLICIFVAEINYTTC